jgi:elongator complex protein 3
MKTREQEILKKIAGEISLKIASGEVTSKKQIHELKKKISKKYHLNVVPSDADIFGHLPSLAPEMYKDIQGLLRKKPVRTISGVAIVAVMTTPALCPHGHCIICPGGPPLSAQSYTGEEPAALRAAINKFDPFLQTQKRIKQLKAIGHPTNKIELIVMGGTFTARTLFYQKWFIKRCYDAMNIKNCRSLAEAKEKNKDADHRCVGLTIETRPDWLRLQQIDQILEFGATRVELGIQSTSDRVLSLMERGHLVTDSIYATRVAKDAGLKICYHLMPGLPGSTPAMDLEGFKEIFDDSRFRPDMLKIYPTLVIKGTPLYELWKLKKYQPLETHAAVKLLAEMKKHIPPWVRVQRIERDIPAKLIEAGIKKSNLRQLVKTEMENTGVRCRCIRCREVGHRSYKDGVFPTKIEVTKFIYDASEGKELFISYEDKINDLLIGYCRLRIPALPHRPEFTSDSAVIRELRIHGRMVPVGDRARDEYQHRGFGENLVRRVEEISVSYGIRKLLILSGAGVKKYYYNLGYEDDGVYVSKIL